MALNWSPESISKIVLSVIIIILIIISYLGQKPRNIKSIFLVELTFFCCAIMFLTQAISFIYLNIFLSQISASLIFISLFFLVLSINNVIHESLISIDTIIIAGIGVLYLYLIFSQDYFITYEGGYPTITWRGSTKFLGYLIQIIICFYLFYWGLKTFLKAPILIKREARNFFIGACCISILSLISYLFTLIDPLFIFISDIFFLAGVTFILFTIIREPKILYILPYQVHRIIVKDKNGNLLYEKHWTNVEFEGNIFAGFLNAVNLMSEKILNIGKPIELNLKKGILIIQDSKFITVGLIASKSSKLLRQTLLKFTLAFEEKFQSILKSGNIKPILYESAHELIEIYFSNFPHSLITGKKNTLLLTANIPKELEYKFEEAFEGEIELKKIKEELAQAPLCVIPEFLSLYEDLNQELIEDSRKEMKKIE